VQFKTDDDYCEVYREGDRVADLPAGAVYEGISDVHCVSCADLRAADVIRSYREALQAMTSEPDVELSIGPDALRGPGGHVELARHFAPLIETARERRTGDIHVVPRRPPIPSTLRIVAGRRIVWPLPAEANPWTAYDSVFWRRLQARVVEELLSRGWSPADDDGRDVAVRIDADQRIAVAAPVEAPDPQEAG
jgi:hypothetical protein